MDIGGQMAVSDLTNWKQSEKRHRWTGGHIARYVYGNVEVSG